MGNYLSRILMPASENREGGEEEFIGICDLPEEVLLQIFSHFSLSDICTKIAPVCHQWSQLTKHPSFWTVLKFDHRIKFTTMCEVLRRATLLKELTVGEVDLTAVVDILAEKCPLLEKFCVTNGYMEHYSLEMLVSDCPGILHLDLKGCVVQCGNPMNHENFDMISKLKKLRVLKASSRVPFDGADLVEIAKMCVDLECLYLNCADLDSELIDINEVVVEIVKHRHGSLRILFLKFLHLSNISFKAIGKCSQLTRLRLEHAYQMSDEGLHALAQLNLTELQIQRNVDHTTSDGFAAMFSNPNLKNLVRLHLSECIVVNDDVLQMIADCCSQSLSWLVLKRCPQITDGGVQVLVQQCHCLKYLDLRHLKISSDALVDILTLLPNLSFLNLKGCTNIKSKVLLAIFRQKPDIRIQDCSGCLVKEEVFNQAQFDFD